MTGAPTVREQALAALAAALARAAGDPAAVFSGELDALADSAAKACVDIEHDLPARLAIGQLHVLRMLTLTVRDDTPTAALGSELQLVGQWLRPVLDTAPEMVPEEVRQAFSTLSGIFDPRPPDAAALRARVRADRASLADAGEGHPDRLRRLISLGIDLRMLFDQTGDLTVLREAAEIGREVVAATSPGHPDFELHLSILSVPLGRLVERTGDLTVLREALGLARYACTAVPGKQAEYQSAYALLLLKLFEHTGDLGTVDEAIGLFRGVVGAIHRDDPEHAGNLSNLSLALRSRYQRTGDKAALLEAVETGRDAVAALPPGHALHGRLVGNLSATLLRLFYRTGDLDVLREAERTGRTAVAEMPDRDDRGIALANLCQVLLKLGERTGDLAALREAVRFGREATATAPAGHPARLLALSNFSLALVMLRELTGDLAPLREAEPAIREAVASAAPADPDRGSYLNILGIVLRMIYEHTQDAAVLREAVSAERAAVAATASGQPERASFVANLALALACLFEATGDIAVLREAERLGREAVTTTPPEDSDYAARTMNVGSYLLRAAERVEETAVLREAVQIARDALAATPRQHPAHARFLANLGNALAALFNRTGEIAALDQAAEASRAAIAAAAPEDALLRTVALLGSAQINLRRYVHTLEQAALQEALRASADAAAAAPPEHQYHARILAVRCHALLLLGQVEHTGDAATLREAVRTGREALASLPSEHAERGVLSVNLGVAHQRLSEHAEARRLFAAAAGMETAPAAVRIHAARHAADEDLRMGDREQAAASIGLALELLPQLASRDLTRADRQYGVGATTGLASTAAAVFLEVDETGRAVEALEQTRGLVLASTLDIRDQHTALHDHAADLAAEFDELCRALDAADHDEGLTRHQRAELNRHWHDLLARIRARPYLETFLQPLSINELRPGGPVVYVLAHDRQGYALVIDGEKPVRVVSLPALTERAAVAQVAALRDARRRADTAAQRRILGVLGWLWDAIAGPVLRDLGHTGPPSAGWPRIWWCPVGVVTFLPLHAAGHHLRTPRTDTVLDRAISSYTPTIRALAHARSRQPGNESMVVIAVPDAPGTAPLPNVEREACLIHDLVPTATMLPAPGTTTRHDLVTEAMERHQIAHFACHGVADLADPSASRLLLHDHQTRPLTLQAITRLDLTDAYLAYLSACSTTDTSPRQADEATHLTAAFQLAGYRNVIGTLWPINDAIAATIAQDFYARHTNPAEALHQALRRCRDDHPEHPIYWAAYIHTGA